MDVAGDLVAVVFLIVAQKMLDRREKPVKPQDATNNRSSGFAAEQRIFGNLFEVAAAKRIALDV